MSKIEWTDVTWNPVTGCSKVSPGCAHCYAEALSLRRGWSDSPWTPANASGNVLLHPDRLKQPAGWRAPRMIFTCSMGDLFHELVPHEYIDACFDVVAACPQHVFQVLTKRPERIHQHLAWQRSRPAAGRDGFPTNAWLGTSIENRRFAGRADLLRTLPCAVRFISAEPLLGPLVGGERWCGACDGYPPEAICQACGYGGEQLDLTGIDQVIVGGESGPGHRPIDVNWVRDLRDVCVEEGVAFFFKQWGGPRPASRGRHLDGRTWDELPAPAVGAGQLELAA